MAWVQGFSITEEMDSGVFAAVVTACYDGWLAPACHVPPGFKAFQLLRNCTAVCLLLW